MVQRERPYSLTLIIYDDLLTAMARIIGAEYVPGSYDEVVEAHAADDDAEDFWWALKGAHGSFNVYIERWESYMHCSLSAQEPHFLEGRKLLWDEAMRRGAKLPERMNPYK